MVGKGREGGRGRKERKGEGREGGKVASWLLGDGRPWFVVQTMHIIRNV